MYGKSRFACFHQLRHGGHHIYWAVVTRLPQYQMHTSTDFFWIVIKNSGCSYDLFDEQVINQRICNYHIKYQKWCVQRFLTLKTIFSFINTSSYPLFVTNRNKKGFYCLLPLPDSSVHIQVDIFPAFIERIDNVHNQSWLFRQRCNHL